MEDLSNEQKAAAYKKLSAQDVRGHIHGIVIPNATKDLWMRCVEDLTSHTPKEMVSKVVNYLKGARGVLNKALEARKEICDGPVAIAADALREILATTFAADSIEEWTDAGSETELTQIYELSAKLWEDVLSFRDAELGINDPFSRDGILYRLDDMVKDWLDAGYKTSSFRTAANSNGKGSN